MSDKKKPANKSAISSKINQGMGWYPHLALIILVVGSFENCLANIWIVNRADVASTILVEVVVNLRGPQNIIVGRAMPALNMEPTSMAVTDGWIIFWRGERVVNSSNKPALTSCQSEGATAFCSVGTGGSGFCFGAGGTHDGGGGADVVFHNDAKLIQSLGFVNRKNREFLFFTRTIA